MRTRGGKVAWMGLLFALSMALSFLESQILIFPVPGIKPGLANIVTMYCLFCFGPKEAYTLAGLRSLFVLLTRGAVACAMSLAGGLVSVTAMYLLHKIGKGRFSQTFQSVCGGLAHNLGQLMAAVPILGSTSVLYYFPILAVSGAAMGLLTGTLLRRLMPRLNQIFF